MNGGEREVLLVMAFGCHREIEDFGLGKLAETGRILPGLTAALAHMEDCEEWFHLNWSETASRKGAHRGAADKRSPC